ncbi:hypothetical protein ES319_A11G123000v1 [Gossypium barbadense]|uniref:RING-type domain-containing protein n=2 Tax=Gossypium TaxID=3633 RepID=A0A5J5TQN4_GOSBA|nr:hypothetical protein ES319_A11G123000v1 [Gossypium barbadense]TYG93702.1 hypothetical protein ES288_A11G131600v1 [Gossypium darwinii]
MKFCKKYQEYMQGQENQMPGVGFKKLKKILNKCRRDVQSKKHLHGHGAFLDLQSCPRHCPVCDGTFFPSLLKEMSDAYFIWFKAKLQGSHIALIQEGKDLVNYAMINAIAIRKILKMIRYASFASVVHYSKQGQAFRSQAQSMHIEIFQSPWLCELMAFHVNLRETKAISGKAPALFEGCYLTFNDGKPFLSCELFDSVKLDIDLTCSICLDTVFDPVSLTCGHIFCSICASSAASVTIVDGLRAANPKEKCPLCREAGVYEGAVHLDELSILLRRSCREYWEQRLKKERVERVRQAKQHWESQCQAFIGL